jgi:thioredoxin-like negative regulator of GroEL
MESLLAQLQRRERERLRISRVDTEATPKLAEKLGVAELPTLVLLVGRKPVARIEGRANAPQIDRMLADHLPGNPDRSLAA